MRASHAPGTPHQRTHLPKQRRTSPSHSKKLTGGGGLRGSMRTTELSTLGGGRKLFLPTLSRCCTLQGQEGGQGRQGGREAECVLSKEQSVHST